MRAGGELGGTGGSGERGGSGGVRGILDPRIRDTPRPIPPVVSEPRWPGSEGGGGRCTGRAGPCGLPASGVAVGAGMVMGAGN